MNLSPTEAKLLADFAATSRQGGKHGAAAALYRTLYLAIPSRDDFLLEAAVSLRMSGQSAEAGLWFEELLAKLPTHYSALLEAGLCKVEIGDYPRALDLFRRADSVQHTADAAMWSGVTLRRLNRHAEALAYFDEALLLNPTLWSVDIEKAGSLEALGRFEQAAVCLRKTLGAAGRASKPFIYNRLGICLDRLRQQGALREMLQSADYCEHMTEGYSFISTVLWSLRVGSPCSKDVVTKFLSTMPKPLPIPVAATVSLYLTAFEKNADLYNEVSSILHNDVFALSAIGTSSKYPLSHILDSLKGAGFEIVNGTVDRLVSAIHLRAPFSLIRLGDGEGNVLAQDLDSGNVFLQEFCKQILAGWFGANSVSVAESRELLLDLKRSIASADFLGVPDRARLIYEQSNDARGYWGVHFATKYVIERTTIRQYVSPVVHLHMFRDQRILEALAACPQIHTVTCHPGFGSKIRGVVGVSGGRDLVVPGEKGIPTLPDSLKKGRHYPDVYRQTIKKIQEFPSGSVVLIAAGVCGKIYASTAKSIGCMGIDVGAIADYFMGIPSRAVFREDHFASGFATTLRQSFGTPN